MTIRAAAGAAATSPADGASPSVDAWLRAHERDIVEQLIGWVRIRSVVGPPEHEIDVVRSAHWLAGVLRETGFPTVEIWPTDSGPAVWAEWCAAPGAPTVLIYSHHDVRAAKDEQWEQCPPFEPALRDGRLFGRGTSDAKGQVLAHIWALRGLLAAGHDAPPVNIKVLVEGEEEIGSPHLRDLLEKRADRIAADFVVYSDTMTWSADAPAVCLGVRGMVKARLEINGPDTDIHAGAVSGVAPNPAVELVRVLGRLHAPDGRVAIPGFYDTVIEAGRDERTDLAELTSDESGWLARTGTRAVTGEAGRSIGERLYLRPAAEVESLLSGDPVGSARGVIPARASAELQLSLVPAQDPAEISDRLRDWLGAEISGNFEWTLTIGELQRQPPYVTPADHPAVPLLIDAMGSAWGRPARTMRNAGTGPAELLAAAVGGAVVFFGTGLPEDHWHGPDESVEVDVLLKGAATLARFWPQVARRLSPRRR